MITPWIGSRRVAVIPARVTDPRYDPPPVDWVDRIRRRLFFDVDLGPRTRSPRAEDVPLVTIDRSLRAYLETVSYGSARLEADVLDVVNAAPTSIDDALQGTPTAHTYEYACVVFNTNRDPNCFGWAWWGGPAYAFNPPREQNVLRAGCRVSMNEPLGVWAMEMTHALAGFPDLYGRPGDPGSFDNMSCSCGTHPSSYTKLKLGWLSPNDVPTVAGGQSATFTVRALAIRPPLGNTVAAVRIPSTISTKYFLVETRLQLDAYERTTSGVSSGIPSEGVVVYEIDETISQAVTLRTLNALAPGDVFADPAEGLQVRNVTAGFHILGTAVVQIQATENPGCANIRRELEELQRELRDFQEQLQTATPSEKPGLVDQIRARIGRIKNLTSRARLLGCNLP